MSDSPNPLAVAWSVWTSLRTTRPPQPAGGERWTHDELVEPLQVLRREGMGALAALTGPVEAYLSGIRHVEPDRLERDEALAFWINVYNAGALLLAAEAASAGAHSVLRVPGGFRRPSVTVAGEVLSLDAIEHAKLRRFGDPRIHAALVCGSVSCPTLRAEPYSGQGISAQLDTQMRTMLADGAVLVDVAGGRVLLSRIFLWYGADFVRPQRMPLLLPVGRRKVLTALSPWLAPDVTGWIAATGPRVEFQSYEWSLACSVR